MVLIQGRPELVTLALNIFTISTVIAFIRYVIGLKHWRNYSAITLGISAFLFASTFKKGAIGLLFWGYFFVSILVFATLTYEVLKHIDMHYFARIGFIYTSGVIALLVSTLLLTRLTPFNPLKYNYSTLGLLLLLLPLDDITLLRMRKSTIEYIRRLLGTILISTITASLLLYDKWNNYLYTHQEVVIFFIIALMIISQWTFINFSDYLRFRSIVNKKND